MIKADSSIVLVIPHDNYVKQLKSSIDYLCQIEDYEKAADKREELINFIKEGKDKNYTITLTSNLQATSPV